MEQIRKVFLSSTSRELAEHRGKVIDALQRLDGWDVIHMERFGARAWAADDFCLKKVRECDVFVGIAGFCYGSVQKPSGKSYTEREYDEAVRVARPRLMYVAPDDFKVEAKVLLADGNPDRQAAFREVIDSQQIRDEFESPENLAKRVVVDLRNWERENPLLRENHLPREPKEGWPRSPDLVHPYPLQPNFTGRIAERKWLTEWFTADSRPVCVVEPIGGMGKSALAWFWLHADVLGKPPAGYSGADPENPRVPEDQRPEGVLFWSFYEQDSRFGAFLDRAVGYVGASDTTTDTPSDREKLEIVLGALEQRRILLILDGFERELRAYAGYRAPYQGDEGGGEDGNDCVDPRAAEFLRSAASLALVGRVLLTSRLFPNELTDLAGCRHERLKNLALDDGVSFFGATGVKGTRAEISQAVASYGGHPLSVSLLARAIVRDRKMRGDIKASRRHTVLDKLKGKQGHDILAVAYGEMSDEHRELLSRIAAFRSPMDYDALRQVARPTGLIGKLLKRSLWSDAALDELEARGLLLRDPESERYDLHPIVRQYAYDRLADKAGVHGRLREYFEARPPPARVETLADLAPTIELYWHTVGAGRFDEARELLRDRLIPNPLHFRFGAYQQMIELLGALFPEGKDRPPQLSSERDQSWTLNNLANSYGSFGQPRRAVPLFEMQMAIDEKQDDKKNLAVGLANLVCVAQLPLGELEAAEGALRRSIELCREIADEFIEAFGHQELGRLLAYAGRFAEAEHELKASTRYWKKTDSGQGLSPFRSDLELSRRRCADRAYRALLSLVQGDFPAALATARESRRLADVDSLERDIIWAEWLLGWAHTVLGETAAAEPHLNEALSRCRRINLIHFEPSILLASARWHHGGGDGTQARRFAEDALRIADRCEYRLNQADIHNFLARLAVDSGKPAEARDQAQKAKDYAYCDGPPHYYKPAHEEAERLLSEAAKAQGASAGKQ